MLIGIRLTAIHHAAFTSVRISIPSAVEGVAPGLGRSHSKLQSQHRGRGVERAYGPLEAVNQQFASPTLP